MKLEQMAVVLAQASSVFSNFTLTKEAIKTWHSLFSETSLETFHAALRICIKEPGRSFFPTPGEVNKIILKMKMAEIPDGDEVWCTLLNYASGGAEDLADKYLMNNEAGQRALRQVSFHALRYSDIETELPWVRKEFLRAYAEISESASARSQIYIGKQEAAKILGNISKAIGGSNES